MKTFNPSTRTWVLAAIVAIAVAIVAATVVGGRYERIREVDRLLAEHGLKSLESALLSYRQDIGTFPSTEQGLQALLTPPKDVAVSWAGPYLSKLPVDTWATPYQYSHPADASDGFAIYSLGADAAPGGDGANADIRVLASGHPEPQENKVVSGKQGEPGEPEVTQETATPPKQTGAPLHIETVPADARVRIMDIAEIYQDGMELPPREYRVEVSATGFHTKEEVVWHGMLATTYRIALDRIPPEEAPLFVETDPPNALVSVIGNDDSPVWDSRQMPPPGLQLPPGDYQVEVEAEGFHTKEEVVRHGRSATTHRIVLDRVPPEDALLFIETVPPSAQVSVMGGDGTALWDSMQMRRPGVQLSPGDYWVEVRAEGYDVKGRLVSHGRSPTTHRIVLDRAPPKEAPLFVETDPANALVKVVRRDGSVVWNLRQMRRPGVQLPPGVYSIDVSAQGFRGKTETVSHGASALAMRVALVAIAPPPDQSSVRHETPPTNDQEYRLVKRVEPNFPLAAQRKGMDGHVLLRYTIAPTGHVQDIEVVESNPRGVFDRAARVALRKWRYTPRTVDGVPVEVRGVNYRFRFRLED